MIYLLKPCDVGINGEPCIVSIPFSYRINNEIKCSNVFNGPGEDDKYFTSTVKVDIALDSAIHNNDSGFNALPEALQEGISADKWDIKYKGNSYRGLESFIQSRFLGGKGRLEPLRNQRNNRFDLELSCSVERESWRNYQSVMKFKVYLNDYVRTLPFGAMPYKLWPSYVMEDIIRVATLFRK